MTDHYDVHRISQETESPIAPARGIVIGSIASLSLIAGVATAIYLKSFWCGFCVCLVGIATTVRIAERH